MDAAKTYSELFNSFINGEYLTIEELEELQRKLVVTVHEVGNMIDNRLEEIE